MFYKNYYLCKCFLTILKPKEMATFKGPFNFKGKLGNIRYYEVPGDDRTYAAERGFVSKNILDHGAAFAESRKTRDEFSPKSRCAKDIRLAFGKWAQPIVNRQLHCRLISIMNDIVNMDKEHDKGHRALYLSRYKNLLFNADYHFLKPLTEILRCPYTIEPDENRNTVTVTIKGLNPSKQIKAPPLATHFQLCLGLGRVKDYVHNANLKNWEPTPNQKSHVNNQILTAWIPIDAGLLEDMTLSVSIPEEDVIGDNVTVIRGFGIRFGRMTGEVVLLEQERGSIAFLGPR